MKLSNLRKENRGGEVALVADVECAKFAQWGGDSEKNTIWVSVPKEFEDYLTIDRYDGFLVALLFPAMKCGDDIFIDGAVSKRLMKNLDYTQALLKTFTSYLSKINVSSKDMVEKKINTNVHVATAFSGGVDSFCTIYDKFECENDPQYKVDTLVCFNVAHYGRSNEEEYKKTWEDNFKFLSNFPKEVGLPYIPVNSNFGAYIVKETYWEEIRQFGMPLIVGAILSLQNRFSIYYAPSNYPYIDLLRHAFNDCPSKYFVDGDYMEYFFYNLVSTESLEIIVDGSQYSRSEKTERISNYSPTYKYLDVSCRFVEKKNSPFGLKTNRVLWALESLDKLDLYSESFDLVQWKKDAFGYKCRQMFFHRYVSSFVKDNIQFARKHGKKVPSYFVAFLYVFLYKPLLSFIKNSVMFPYRVLRMAKSVLLKKSNCRE